MPDRSPLFRAVLTALAFVLLSPDARARAAATDSVRVRVLEHAAPSAVALRAPDGAHVFAGDVEAPLLALGRDEAVRMSLRRGEVFIETEGRGIYARRVRVEPGDGGVAVSVAEGRSQVERAYAGRLYLTPAPDGRTLQLVNVVELEAYVAGVVASEYGLDDDEGTKAMAVVARTYALNGKDATGGGYEHVDHVASQVYRGMNDIPARVRAAVEATRGEILTYGDAPAEVVYSASSGGHTAANESVWRGKPLPYLRARPDPYDTASPYHRWTSALDREAVLDALGRGVTGFVIDETDEAGRVLTVELITRDGRRTMTGNAFRMAITRRLGVKALRSTFFDARRSGSQYVFEGRGFGHGVGLSQWGAHEMARQGHDYTSILGFYFPGTRLRGLDGMPEQPLLGPLPASAPVATTPSSPEALPERAASADVRGTDAPVVEEDVEQRPAPKTFSGRPAEEPAKKPRKRRGW